MNKNFDSKFSHGTTTGERGQSRPSRTMELQSILKPTRDFDREVERETREVLRSNNLVRELHNRGQSNNSLPSTERGTVNAAKPIIKRLFGG